MPHKPDSLVSDQQSRKVDWREKLLDRDGLDLALMVRTLRASRNALAPLVANRSTPGWLEIADASDELSDRIAEIEHVIEREAERKEPRRVFAYQDMKGAAE